MFLLLGSPLDLLSSRKSPPHLFPLIFDLLFYHLPLPNSLLKFFSLAFDHIFHPRLLISLPVSLAPKRSTALFVFNT